MAETLKREIIVLDEFPIRRNETGPAPIPDGAKVGNVVASSPMLGRGEGPESQAAAMFNNIRTFMKRAGGSPENIVLLTVTLEDDAHRALLNAEWLKMFPDPNNRPARIITHREFNRQEPGVPAGPRVYFQVSLLAVL